MCTLQAPEFVFVSFAVEMDWFLWQSLAPSIGAEAGWRGKKKD